MANVIPTQIFPGYQFVAASGTVAADSIVIPLSALSGLTSSEANATTGNGSEVVRNIIDAATTNVNALATEAKPTQMTLAKGTPTKVGSNDRQPYTVTFVLTPTGYEMATEPA